jgi:hypothetical protein
MKRLSLREKNGKSICFTMKKPGRNDSGTKKKMIEAKQRIDEICLNESLTRNQRKKDFGFVSGVYDDDKLSLHFERPSLNSELSGSCLTAASKSGKASENLPICVQ